MLHQLPQLSALYDTAKHTTSQPHIRFAFTALRPAKLNTVCCTSLHAAARTVKAATSQLIAPAPNQAVGRDDAETLSPFSAVRPHPSCLCSFLSLPVPRHHPVDPSEPPRPCRAPSARIPGAAVGEITISDAAVGECEDDDVGRADRAQFVDDVRHLLPNHHRVHRHPVPPLQG